MRVTYQDPEGKNSMGCDIATRKVDLMPLYLDWSIKNNETDITYAKLELLLADKIQTSAERAEKNNPKGATDIKFCVTEMFLQENKMSKEFKSLYTSENWDKVVQFLTTDEGKEGWDLAAQALEVSH